MPGATDPISAPPFATVVVPVWGDVDVRPCVASLLAQDAPGPVEVLVVDNGGRVAGLPVPVLREETPGSYAARNRGLAAARGPVTVFVDADCVADPDLVAALVRCLEDPSIVAVGGTVRGAAEPGLVSRLCDDAGFVRQSRTLGGPRPYLQTAALAVRTAEARAVGGFDATLRSGGDADLCWRLTAAGGALGLVDSGVVHRDRHTWRGLCAQLRRFGQGKAQLSRKHGTSPREAIRQLAGDLAVLALAPPWALAAVPAAVLARDWLPVARPGVQVLRVVLMRAGGVEVRLRGRPTVR